MFINLSARDYNCRDARKIAPAQKFAQIDQIRADAQGTFGD